MQVARSLEKLVEGPFVCPATVDAGPNIKATCSNIDHMSKHEFKKHLSTDHGFKFKRDRSSTATRSTPSTGSKEAWNDNTENRPEVCSDSSVAAVPKPRWKRQKKVSGGFLEPKPVNQNVVPRLSKE